ncbi:MAG: hypothetical protein PF481_07580 [Bacteroidales bacterium]|jgi:hypothetical protein|nr:hypothetical protein [Bacteroidales bacterium]
MAEFNLETTVTAPDKVEVQLVRADYYETSNIFRTCFEFALALTSALTGAILSIDNITNLHWCFLVVSVIATGGFLYLTNSFKKKAHKKK